MPLYCQTLTQPAAFQASAHLLTPEEISPSEANLAWRTFVPTEEKNSVPANSISEPQFAKSLPDITLPPPLGTPRYATLASQWMNLYEVSVREGEVGIRKSFSRFQRSVIVS